MGEERSQQSWPFHRTPLTRRLWQAADQPRALAPETGISNFPLIRNLNKSTFLLVRAYASDAVSQLQEEEESGALSAHGSVESRSGKRVSSPRLETSFRVLHSPGPFYTVYGRFFRNVLCICLRPSGTFVTKLQSTGSGRHSASP